jgi:hypothetical protein
MEQVEEVPVIEAATEHVVTNDAPKKRAKGMSPTARTLAECRKRGWSAQVVERFNSFTKRRIDLFGCIDIVVITPDGILGVQACAGGDHSTRRNKILLEPRIKQWLDAGGLFEVWSWSKKGHRWHVRIDDVSEAVHAHAAHLEARSAT